MRKHVFFFKYFRHSLILDTQGKFGSHDDIHDVEYLFFRVF